MSINPWQLKLAAWTHDPAEKALILMRDRIGHEGGTVKALQQTLFGGKPSSALEKFMNKADHWAAAADRPSFPGDEFINSEGGKKLSDRWSSVRFYNNPVLIHPLSGERFDIKDAISGISVDPIKSVSFDHFDKLVQKNNDAIDHKKTALTFWRFGPHLQTDLGAIWELLPADTRIPDHSIWSHLDLTAAFATGMALSDDENPALLSMSFGPVQDFIAQARSTSDLWAGSHLLSRMVWEGLKEVCENLGPDAVVFPQLRGVALVDAWLHQDMGLSKSLFEDHKQNEWLEKSTDENPLFAAALPNKFMAIVPSSQAKDIAEKITARVRAWVKSESHTMLEMLLKEGGVENKTDLPCWAQLQEQLEGFPEIHWASASWAIIDRDANDKADAAQATLKNVQTSFIPETESFLDKSAWKLLARDIQLDGAGFYTPNPGVLYAALFDLLDRVNAAAKVTRRFTALTQTGYRCTLTGEHEWLTTDKSQLIIPPTQRQKEKTLWNTLSANNKFGLKKGEHLGALGMFKRLWPRRFSDWAGDLLDEKINRFVVSTHTLAIASSLQNLSDLPEQWNQQAISTDGVILPKKLARQLRSKSLTALNIAKGIPALIDSFKGSDSINLYDQLMRELKKATGSKPEAYFAMLYMDGDKMGAWLADSWPKDENQNRLRYEQTWHPLVVDKLKKNFPQEANTLRNYLESHRPISPARHMAISGALNSFALNIARYVVEECYMGKLLYAGGDDVMAMVAVKDLLPCMLTLRLAYSGVWPEESQRTQKTLNLLYIGNMRIGGGHVHLNSRLHQVMGNKATASIGAVIAHHAAPLSHVLRELRSAEKIAKNAGRDAFAVRVLKRGGGAEDLSLKWLLESKGQQWAKMPELESTSMGLLMELRDQLSGKGDLSRRVAYVVNSWLPQLPNATIDDDKNFVAMIETTLSYQLDRQGGDGRFAAMLIDLAGRNKATTLKENLRGVFAVAEFFAREGRAQQGGSQ